jgi:hypothetical protein
MYHKGLSLNKSLIKADIYQRNAETGLHLCSVKKMTIIIMYCPEIAIYDTKLYYCLGKINQFLNSPISARIPSSFFNTLP